MKNTWFAFQANMWSRLWGRMRRLHKNCKIQGFELRGVVQPNAIALLHVVSCAGGNETDESCYGLFSCCFLLN